LDGVVVAVPVDFFRSLSAIQICRMKNSIKVARGRHHHRRRHRHFHNPHNGCGIQAKKNQNEREWKEGRKDERKKKKVAVNSLEEEKVFSPPPLFKQFNIHGFLALISISKLSQSLFVASSPPCFCGAHLFIHDNSDKVHFHSFSSSSLS
jgi:hypothetical protein